MNQLTKAQLTVGALACFATIWTLVLNREYQDLLSAIGLIVLQIAVILVLAYAILAILEWVKVFDLKTNAILTLIVLVTVRLLSSI